MKRLLFLIFSIWLCVLVQAQELKVKSFFLAATDISAQTQPRKDLNDEPCALVKVQFVGDVLDAEGNVIKPLVKKNYETWVYLTHGSRQMQVTAKNNLPLMVKFADYGVESVEKNRTYVLVLNQGSMTSNPLSADVITIPVKDGINIEMVKVEAGTFVMGNTNEYLKALIPTIEDDEPKLEVTLTNGYYIAKYEVTQALWQSVMGNNPSGFKGDDLPVEWVSWNDCQNFISKLNSITGKKFRLPTEAEWEYAAKGGKKNHNYGFSGSSDCNDVAWYYGNSDRKTHPVGTKQPNDLGIYDMTGNVSEWCQDWKGSYSNMPQTNPTGVIGGSDRVTRGGSFCSEMISCRSSYRCSYNPDSRRIYIGLRLVLSE